MSSRLVPIFSGLVLFTGLATTTIFCNCDPGRDPDLPAGVEGRVLDKKHVAAVEGSPPGAPDVRFPLNERWLLRLDTSAGKVWVHVTRQEWEPARIGDWYGR